MDDPGVLSIQAFLLDHVERGGRPALLAELARHRDRTMTVVYRERTEAITRCGTCPKEQIRPCRRLRALALPYAGQPGYRPEWGLPDADDETSSGRTARQYAVAAPD